ncbi:hypothetical protein [Streptomyces sp. NPDC003697]
MDLDAVAGELYGLRPEDFTAVRDTRAAEARTEGDRALAAQIGKLRRPSLSAWAGNLLVRERPEETEPLVRLGEGLRQAHRDLDGAQLRELGHQQRLLIDALSRQAGRLAAEAGHPIGEDARREVEGTLHAVLADPEAAREWATGRLVKALDPTTGFPAASPGATPRPAGAHQRPAARAPSVRRGTGSDHADKADKSIKADAQRRRRLARARRDADEARRELHDAEREAETAGRAADDAAKLLGDIQRRVRELTDRLRSLEDEQRTARAAEGEARERVRGTDRRVREARRRAEAAAAHVEHLTAEASDRTGV